jgi:hypothetical protein
MARLTNSKLRVCPFCGSVPILEDQGRLKSKRWYAVYCDKVECEVAPHTGWRGSAKGAMRLWNTSNIGERLAVVPPDREPIIATLETSRDFTGGDVGQL